MTGVIVRSATNVNAGAKTRLSVILHGLWLLLAVVALGRLLNHIPTAALAAILVHTGYKLVNPAAVRRLWVYSKMKVLIYSATVITIVLTNLLEGVLIGMGFALADLIHERIQMGVRLAPGPSAMSLKLSGAATFILLPKLATTLQEIPAGAIVALDHSELEYIDLAVIDLLKAFQEQHARTGGRLDVSWVELEKRGRQSRRLAIATKGEAAAILGQLTASGH
jgi:MFS superfamily sulfate permease-like transporter